MSRVTFQSANKLDQTNEYLEFLIAAQLLLNVYEKRQDAKIPFLKRKLELERKLFLEMTCLGDLAVGFRKSTKLSPMGKTIKDTERRAAELYQMLSVVPEADAAEHAGKIIANLPRLWAGANHEERRKLLMTMLDAIYVDAKEEKAIVAIKPKPPFRPIFEMATTRKGSNVMLIKEPPELHDPEARCFWWRRWRVELHVQKKSARDILQA